MKNLNEDIKTFLAHCKFEKNLSPKTVKAYGTDLSQLVVYLKENNHPVQTTLVCKTILREYVQSITKFKPKTVKRKMATLKALFHFLEFEETIEANPFRKMKIQIKVPLNLPNVMSILEVERILKYVYSQKLNNEKQGGYTYFEKIRDVAVLELLFATGVRVSELTNLTIGAVDLVEGLIKVRGKGNKERVIQIPNADTLKLLKEYHGLLKKKVLIEKEYFFINRFNNRLSEQSVRFLVKRIARKAKINRCVTPHVFRHSFATLLLEEDVDIKYIQHLLGHSSIAITQIYTHVNSEKQRKILSLRHPRRNLIMS